jgi:cytochrome bd-type quinol oxidase subunit 1
MKRVGRVLFCLGIVGMITSALIILNTCNHMTNMDDPERAGFAGAVLLVVFIPCVVITILGWCMTHLGKSRSN